MVEKDSISEMLDNEIEALLNELGETEPGTEKHESLVKDLERLYRLRVEETKVVGEIENQREKIEVDRVTNEHKIDAEIDISTDKIVEERRQHKIDKIFTACEIGSKITCAIGLGVLGFMFEEHGHLVSPTFKNLRETFKPRL